MVEFAMIRHSKSRMQETTTQVDSEGKNLPISPWRTNVDFEERSEWEGFQDYMDVISLSVN